MWQYFTPAEAAFFIWSSSAASEWDFYDFEEMVVATKRDSIYGFIDDSGQLLAIVRFSWIVQPYSGYMWIWTQQRIRGKKSYYLINNRIFHELYFLVKEKMKIKKLIALCVKKSTARLCQRLEAKFMCELKDLYYKGRSAYVCYWQFD